MDDRPKLTEQMRGCLLSLVDLDIHKPPMETGYGPRSSREGWFTADHIGEHAKLPRVRRHGNGAVQRSWSGNIAAGFQCANTMMALDRRGLVITRRAPDRERTVHEYKPTEAGRFEAGLLRSEAFDAAIR
jgi:hypothetical protein